MSYSTLGSAALGAGPGPTKTYLVDLPFPWGDDTKVTVPMDAIVKDAIKSVPIKELVESAWGDILPLAEQDLPPMLDTFIGPKWSQAEYIVNRAIADVDEIAARATKHVYIAAALIVAGVAFVSWRMNK